MRKGSPSEVPGNGPRVALALLLALLGLAARGAAAPLAWVEPSWVRVSQTAPAGTATSLDLYAAKGEYESFQIIVRAPAGGLSHVSVLAPDLAGGGTNLLSRANLTLYREHYLHVTTPSPDWHGTNRPLGVGWYPDALIPFVDPATGRDLVGARYDAVPFSLAAEKNQPIWVDVFVPRTIAAGDYQGTFTITSDQGSTSVDLRLHVWNFELPLRSALQSCFGNSSAVDGNEVQELLRHRLMPRSLSPSRERALMDEAGLNCSNAGFWSGADGSRCKMGTAPTVAQFQQAADLHQPDLPLYAYTADEIEPCTDIYATIRAWARNMHQTRLRNLITVPPVHELLDDGSGTGRSAVDIWVMLPMQFEDYAASVAYVLDKGDRVWSYNCLVQDSYSPKWLIDFPPINFRLQPGFLNQSLGLTGLLYWRIDSWTADPWTDPHTYHGGYPGEGFLFYPGADVGLPGQVVPSLRLKYLRDGVEDYDYVQLLKDRGKGEWALSLVRPLAPDWRNWTRDPATVEAVRRQFGPQLETVFSDVPPNYWAYREIMACRTAQLAVGYPDGGYHPVASVRRDQMAVYLARALVGGDLYVPSGPAVASFSDVGKDFWAYDHIEYAVDRGLVKGYQNGTYQPKKLVTRDQMAVFIAHAICDPTGEPGLVGYQPPDRPSFRDVPPTNWAYKYIEYLHGLGLVRGYQGGTYRPARAVTRDQMAVYLANAFHLPLPEE